MNNATRGLVALAMLITAKKLKDKKDEENKKTSEHGDQTKSDVNEKQGRYTLSILDFTLNI